MEPTSKRLRSGILLSQDSLADGYDHRISGRVACRKLGLNHSLCSFRSFPEFLLSDESALEVLRKDCRTACATQAAKAADPECGERYFQGETFWVASGAIPATALEKLVLSIFRMHTLGTHFDCASSGAEWWTRCVDVDEDIGWHWDRDYALELDSDLQVHPDIATVTYLSGCGAPTVILEAVEGDGKDREGVPQSVPAVHVSHPRVGKHVAFDGRWLHAAITELAVVDARIPVERSLQRISLLVNIWFNHRPQSARDFHTPGLLSPACATIGLVSTVCSEEHTCLIPMPYISPIDDRDSWIFGAEGVDGGSGDERCQKIENRIDGAGGQRRARAWRISLPVQALHVAGTAETECVEKRQACSSSFTFELAAGLAEVVPLVTPTRC